MAKRHTKSCLELLVIRKLQIKMAVKYHTLKWLKFKGMYPEGCRTPNIHILLVRMQNTHSQWKTVWHFLTTRTFTKKPNNPIPTYLPKRNENINSHKSLFSKILSDLMHNSKKLETIQIFMTW